MTGPPFEPPPPPGWYPPPPPSNSGGTVAGLAVVGVLLFGMINLVVGLIVLTTTGSRGPSAVAFGAAVLALVAIAGGAGLIALRRPWARGLGMGLMIGWALLSVVSVGYCTGLNPEMYTGGM